MEGFFESFIYLLITIVILVLSMRKKKPVEQAPEEEAQPGDPFSDVFGDEDEDIEAAETVPGPVTSGARKEEPAGGKSVQWMSEAEAKEMLMDADAVMKEAAANNPIARLEGRVEQVYEDAYNVGGPEGGGVPFNLRKAVIYYEILDRRTF